MQISSVSISKSAQRSCYVPSCPVTEIPYFGACFTGSMSQAQSPVSSGNTRVSGCLGKPLPAPRQPLQEASNPRLMGFRGSIYIHLHQKRLPRLKSKHLRSRPSAAASYTAESPCCGTSGSPPFFVFCGPLSCTDALAQWSALLILCAHTLSGCFII